MNEFDSKKYVGLVYGPTGNIVGIFGDDEKPKLQSDCLDKLAEVRQAWDGKEGSEPIWELYVRERDID